MVVLLLLIVIGGGGAWYYSNTYGSIIANSTSQTATKFGTSRDGNALNANNGNTLAGKRTNILLLGSDTDAKFGGPGGTYLAQTDIILTIDTQTNYIGMLSIPRDLQVTVPGYSPMKLDEAFSRGFTSKKTANPYADAAGLSIASIEQNFGIPIDQYAWVGLDGFIKVIDTAGGVDVDVIHPMVDDTYPDDVSRENGKTVSNQQAFGYKRLYIAPGPQHMNGINALEYVRTRHSDLVGDFGRSVRQQQVLNQLKSRLAKPDVVQKLPELAKDLDGYVKTSMSITDLVSLANIARTIDVNKVDRVVLGPPYSVSMKHSSNFAPVCDKIIPQIQKMFGLTAQQATCIPQASTGTATVASAAQPASSASARATTSSNATAQAVNLGKLARTNALQVSQGDTTGSTGVRALLNLMFLVSLESPGAMATT